MSVYPDQELVPCHDCPDGAGIQLASSPSRATGGEHKGRAGMTAAQEKETGGDLAATAYVFALCEKHT